MYHVSFSKMYLFILFVMHTVFWHVCFHDWKGHQISLQKFVNQHVGCWVLNSKPLETSEHLSIHHVFSVPHFILNFIYNTFQKILMGWGMKTCPNKDFVFSFWYAFASQSLLSNPLLRTWSSPPLLLTWGLCPFFYYFACPPYTPKDLGEPKSACNPWVQKPSLALQGTQSAVLTVTLKAM